MNDGDRSVQMSTYYPLTELGTSHGSPLERADVSPNDGNSEQPTIRLDQIRLNDVKRLKETLRHGAQIVGFLSGFLKRIPQAEMSKNYSIFVALIGELINQKSEILDLLVINELLEKIAWFFPRRIAQARSVVHEIVKQVDWTRISKDSPLDIHSVIHLLRCGVPFSASMRLNDKITPCNLPSEIEELMNLRLLRTLNGSNAWLSLCVWWVIQRGGEDVKTVINCVDAAIREVSFKRNMDMFRGLIFHNKPFSPAQLVANVFDALPDEFRVNFTLQLVKRNLIPMTSPDHVNLIYHMVRQLCSREQLQEEAKSERSPNVCREDPLNRLVQRLQDYLGEQTPSDAQLVRGNFSAQLCRWLSDQFYFPGMPRISDAGEMSYQIYRLAELVNRLASEITKSKDRSAHNKHFTASP